jgi:hypothetical protein
VVILEEQKVRGRPELPDRGNCPGPAHKVAKLPVGEPMDLNAESGSGHDASIEDAPCLVGLAPELLPEVFHALPKVLEALPSHGVLLPPVARAKGVVNSESPDRVIGRAAVT